MKNDWYASESWYSPLMSEEENTCKGKSRREIRNKRPLNKFYAVGAVSLAVLLIVTSSIILGASAPSSDVYSNGSSGDSSDMPGNYVDFFNEYYTSTETEDPEYRIEKYTKHISFTMEYETEAAEEMTLRELYSQCADTVVMITGYKNNVSGRVLGTGIVISTDGIIITNAHVIEDCDAAVITMFDETEYKASLIGADETSDLALLKIQAKGLKAAKIADSSTLAVGDKVAAIGNPLAEYLRWTLTDGVISAISRGINVNGKSMTLLQTNAAMNSGNSGGPLFNMYGQVVGITNMKLISSMSNIEGIGFAIPTATIKTVVNSLIEYGVVKGRVSLGITVGPIPDKVREYYGLPNGLYVSAVAEGSDALEKGILAGDIILAANGTELNETDDLLKVRNEFSVGDTIRFEVWREGETFEVDVLVMDSTDIS